MTKKKYLRRITVYKEYFKDFKRSLPVGALRKIYQVFLFIMTLEIIPTTYLKSITGVAGLFEIRIEDEGNIYRIFCCFDEGNLVVLFNAFQKKTQKPPQNEIEKAKRLMKEYFENKNRVRNG